MNVKTLLVIGALIAGGYGYNAWRVRAAAVPPDAHGFVPVAMADGAQPNTVIILAPLNCPSDAAQRAESLARRLGELGVPHVRANSYEFSNADPAVTARTVKILEGQIPAVIVDGMGQANPSAEQVVAEYRQARAQRRATQN
jgi:hypothetical protein